MCTEEIINIRLQVCDDEKFNDVESSLFVLNESYENDTWLVAITPKKTFNFVHEIWQLIYMIQRLLLSSYKCNLINSPFVDLDAYIYPAKILFITGGPFWEDLLQSILSK